MITVRNNNQSQPRDEIVGLQGRERVQTVQTVQTANGMLITALMTIMSLIGGAPQNGDGKLIPGM